MFASLNRFIARLDTEPQAPPSQRGIFGFQVLRNNNTETAIEPWFDFIVGINGHGIVRHNHVVRRSILLTEHRRVLTRHCSRLKCATALVRASISTCGVQRQVAPGTPLYNKSLKNLAHTCLIKGQRRRSLYVYVPQDGSGLGLSLQWAPLTATEDVWHILDVAMNSPADVAGLFPYGDYVLGSPDGLARGESGLVDLIEAVRLYSGIRQHTVALTQVQHIDRPLRLWVYNHEYNVTRLVTITPSRSWGGSGALGCILGFGALHRIPASLDEPPQAPGETLFEGRPSMDSRPQTSSGEAVAVASYPLAPPQSSSPQLMIPAEMSFPPAKDALAEGGTSKPPGASAPPMSMGGRRPKAHHTKSSAKTAALDMDDYFNEGETKSKENDFAPSPKPGSNAIAPPPKATGPPPKVTGSGKESQAAEGVVTGVSPQEQPEAEEAETGEKGAEVQTEKED